MEKTNTAKIGDWVIYKNNQLIAFNKPVGLSVQSDKTGDITLFQLAEIYCKSKLFLIHRLDRPASGIVLFGKTRNAAAHLSKQFKDRKINKTYLAVVGQLPPKTEDSIQHFLIKNGKVNKSRAGTTGSNQGLQADLKYKLLGSIDYYHLLEVDMLTGRHHQIRAQLALMGCPIKGDVKYGFKRGNKDRSIHLHGWKLSFTHPVSGERTELVADPPVDNVWNAIMEISHTPDK